MNNFTYNRLNNLTGWAVFAVALVTYLLTVSPTASFWDCGEFIACSNELQVPHPPGAPLYLMLGRLFAMFSGPESAAYMINLLSVIASAFTVLFTFWTITLLGRRMLQRGNEEGQEPSDVQKFVLMAAGVVGGLTCTFADSIWFNAVEAEVYAISSFFTAIVFWLIFKWDARAHEPNSNRWLILIAYIMGLSIGVHLLNLLTIPALVLVVYYRRYSQKVTALGVTAALGLGVVILAVVLYVLMLGTFDVAKAFENVFTGYVDANPQLFPDSFRSPGLPNPDFGTVSGWGLPMGTGAMVWFALLIGGMAWGIWYTHKKGKVLANTALLSTVMVYLGISTYAMIYVRSGASPPINENDPSNMETFLSYMKREQYGNRPLLSGPMYSTQPSGYAKLGFRQYVFHEAPTLASLGEEGRKLAAKGVRDEHLRNRYVRYMETIDYDFDQKRTFPRMYSRQPGHYYGAGHGSYYNYVRDKGANPSPDAPQDDNPSGSDNFKFFLRHQVNHMYLRYFAQNFIGRESDIQDSGFSFTGSDLPETYRNEPSHNRYFALPLLLGLLGLVLQFTRRSRDGFVMLLFFLFTGLAIILYLNQTPAQPRERDYSYAGSFQAFAIWVGLGVIALWDLLNLYVMKNKHKLNAYIAGGLAFVAVPLNMGAQNWKDHSRAGNYVAPDSARALLESCAENGILFTNGDNDTFPLWYLQEVEGVRTDVRIVNLSLLNTNWYIHDLRREINGALPIPLTIPEWGYMGEKNQTVPVRGDTIRYTLPVDREAVIRNGVVAEADSALILPEIDWVIPVGSYLEKGDVMIIDMVREIAKAGWNRPIYFAITVPPSSYLNLMPYFEQEGMAYRLVPKRVQPAGGGARYGVNRERMYDVLMNKYIFRGMERGTTTFFDANIRRMMTNFRQNFIQLASVYMEDARRLQQQIDVFTALNRTDTTEGMKAQMKALYVRVDTLLQTMDYRFDDEACPSEAYVNAQVGQMYAQIGDENLPGATEKAKAFLSRAVRRANAEIEYRRDVIGETIGGQADPEAYALMISAVSYSDIGNAEEARKIAQQLTAVTGIPDYQRQIEAQIRASGADTMTAPEPSIQDSTNPDSQQGS